MTRHHRFSALALLATTVLLASCSSAPAPAEVEKASADMLRNSFQARGIATLDRLDQDQANSACATAEIDGKPLDDKLSKTIEDANMKDGQVAVGRQVPG